jgi:tetratricopeptide (TPR) repeat protein
VLLDADNQRPDYPLPLAMLVKVSLIAGDIEAVKESLRMAAQRFPHDGKLHAEFAKDLLRQKRLDLALAEALRFAGSGDRDPEAAITLAAIENEAGAFGDAARHALAVEAQPDLPVAQRASAAAVAGLAYESLGQFEPAAEHLRHATELAPTREDPYLALARVYQKQQNAKAALDILEQARRQIPASPNVLLALGSQLVSAEQYQVAVRILAALIQSAPDQFAAYPKLAEAYRNLGEAARATETLRRLAQRKPDYPMLHVVIAQSMLDEESIDYPGVLKELAVAEEHSPADYDVYYLRGKVYLATDQYRQAVDALRHAITLRPADAGAYYQLGLAYRRSGQAALAKEQFDRVEHLKNQSPAR